MHIGVGTHGTGVPLFNIVSVGLAVVPVLVGSGGVLQHFAGRAGMSMGEGGMLLVLCVRLVLYAFWISSRCRALILSF